MSKRGVHVPLIADWPRYREAFDRMGHTNNGLVDFTDFFTTFADLAAAELPRGRVMDGVSLSGALRGEQAGTPREFVFCHYWGFGRREEDARTSLHDGRWKLYDEGSFFDLADDPEEASPIRRDEVDEPLRARREQMKQELGRILRGEGDSGAGSG